MVMEANMTAPDDDLDAATYRERLRQATVRAAELARRPVSRVRSPKQAELEMVEAFVSSGGDVDELHHHVLLIDRIFTMTSPRPPEPGCVKISLCRTSSGAWWFRFDCPRSRAVVFLQSTNFVSSALVPWIATQPSIGGAWLAPRAGITAAMLIPGGVC